YPTPIIPTLTLSIDLSPENDLNASLYFLSLTVS
ncbi:unnamed protein product, partial [marine sediment metagenome]